MARDIPLPHPGEILKEEFLMPMGLSVYALAKAIHAPRSRLNDICHGRQAITPAMAIPAFLALSLSKGRRVGSGGEFARTLRRCSG